MAGKAAGSPAYWRYAGDRERSQAPAGPGQRKETSDTGHWCAGIQPREIAPASGSLRLPRRERLTPDAVHTPAEALFLRSGDLAVCDQG